MRAPLPTVSGTDWKRPLRLLTLAIGGTAGVVSRWLEWPRWIGMTIAVAALTIWFVSGFESVKAGETEAHRRQRMRNLAIGLALGAFVLLFYLATLARLGGNALNRPI